MVPEKSPEWKYGPSLNLWLAGIGIDFGAGYDGAGLSWSADSDDWPSDVARFGPGCGKQDSNSSVRDRSVGRGRTPCHICGMPSQKGSTRLQPPYHPPHPGGLDNSIRTMAAWNQL